MRPTRLALAAFAALVALPAHAAVLYKLTDRFGRVTYADAPPRGFDGSVQRLDIDTSANAVAPADIPLVLGEAAARAPTYEEIIRRRPASAPVDRVDAAQARVEAARAALQQAQDHSSADDWIWFGPNNPVGMRRAPKPEYLARLQALEADLADAEQQLADAQR